MSLNHAPSKSFATAVTGSEYLNFKTRLGVTWLGDQVSTYEEEALVNPFRVMGSTFFNICHYLMDSAMGWHHLLYSLVFAVIIAMDVIWYTEDKPMQMPSELKEVIGKFQALSVFLLAFFVNNMIGRWWRLRTAGVEAVQGANCNIAAQLGIVYADIHHQCHDQHVLNTVLAHISNIRRYSASSLYWIFMESGQHDFDHENLQTMGFLTPSELEILDNLPRGTQPEYLWSVIGTESAKIFEEMLEIETFDAYYRVLAIEELNHSWLKGRGGVGLIKEHLTCQIPFDYAVIVSGLMMINNCLLFSVYAVEVGKTVKVYNVQQVVAFICADFFLLHFLAVVFNLLTTMSARADNPFDEGRVSFPGWRYVHRMLEDFEVMANIKPDQHGSSTKTKAVKHDAKDSFAASKPFAKVSSTRNSELKFRPRASQSAKNNQHFG